MKKIILLLFTCFIVTSSFAQLEKGNWLVGGSGSFSSERKSRNDVTQKITQINVNPEIGYFFMDKLVGGFKPLYFHNIITPDNDITRRQTNSRLGVGTFLGYYFLNNKNPFNLFTQLEYGFTRETQEKLKPLGNDSMFKISGGPVYFVNESIGINLLMGYSVLNRASILTGESRVIKEFSSGIGLQIHLTKK